MHKKILPVLITTIIAALCASFILFAFFNNWLIINLPFGVSDRAQQSNSTVSKKQLDISYFKHNQLQHEQKELIWSDQPADNLTHLVKTWLTLLDEEELLLKKASLQTVALSAEGDEAFVSLDRAPFNESDATFSKWMLIESLLKTIHRALPKIKQIRLLTHHQPINDYHLDFSPPWTIGGFLDAQIDTSLHPSTNPWDKKRVITIMLDPAGDAQNTGRIIGDSFERGITLQYAQALKKALEAQSPRLRVILTRFPGETLEPLQNAAFSNRLQADFYLSINFYPANKGLARCFLYYFVFDPITDFWSKKDSKLNFTPYNHAHLSYITSSYRTSAALQGALRPFEQHGLFALEPISGIPFKPLVGVQTTAIGCEIGLHHKDNWQLFVEPMAQAITTAIT